MKKFDVLVIGAGSGLDIATYFESQGASVALLEEGPLGGTCLNRGCIPSKMLLHSADVAETIKNAQKFGIKAQIEGVDFSSIVRRVNSIIDTDAETIEKAIRKQSQITLYKRRGKFVGEKQLQVEQETITADKIYIFGGTRASVPPIPGLDSVPYLTSTEALRLDKQPQHLIIIGGGYIACELAHFFGGLGTKITMLVRDKALLTNEDTEISEWFTKEFSQKYQVMFGVETEAVSSNSGKITVKLKGSGDKLICDQLLIATGRVPNSDTLDVKATGVELDDKGYIKVDDYLETSVKNIFAGGDIVGKFPFKHTANEQAEYLISSFHHSQHTSSYRAIPHAVFSSPQVAGVGKSEQELQTEGITYQVGRAEFKDTGMGEALQENGLVKVLSDETRSQILGCHIVGPDASTLIHEVVVAMKMSGKVEAITDSVHVHPALSEVVQRALLSIA